MVYHFLSDLGIVIIDGWLKSCLQNSENQKLRFELIHSITLPIVMYNRKIS